MAENGEKTFWNRWLVGTLWILVYGLMSLIGTSVIANDRVRAVADEKQVEETNEVKQDVVGIKKDLVYLKEASMEQKTDMRELIKMVQDIKRNTT